MQKVERHLTCVYTISFFLPSFQDKNNSEYRMNSRCLFYPTYDYGKMKPCRVQQKDK